MQVSVAMYRHFPSLSISTPLSHDLIRHAAPLNISTCSESALMPLMQLFQPCEPVGSATFTTEPVDTSIDGTHDEYGSHEPEATSLAQAVMTQDAVGRATSAFTASGDIPVEIRPGVAALTSSQRTCQLTDVFALSSSSVDVYISARDTTDTFRNYRCSEHAQVVDGINWTSCRCAPSRLLLDGTRVWFPTCLWVYMVTKCIWMLHQNSKTDLSMYQLWSGYLQAGRDLYSITKQPSCSTSLRCGLVSISTALSVSLRRPLSC
jgi:hypothetical protein